MANFTNAADRHYRDAEILYRENRLANADHLYGLSVECYLKAEMINMNPHFINSSGELNAMYRIHVNKLWNNFENYIQGRTTALVFIKSQYNPFTQWDISDRYEDESNPKFGQNVVDNHRSETTKIRSALMGATP